MTRSYPYARPYRRPGPCPDLCGFCQCEGLPGSAETASQKPRRSREGPWPIKRRGAADVFGVDISGEMAAVAQALEERNPLGVRYGVGDVGELRPLGQHFDVAVAVQLLNYAQDVAAFEQMCRNVHRNLAPGAEFFVLNQAPDYRFDGPSPDKYGFRSELTGEETETGPRVRITALLDQHPIEFVTTCPRREVYEKCLRAAGFSEVAWVPVEVSDAGVRTFGADFRADFLATPPLEMLGCRA
ncbi:class I SAM-dependent methyltransferase [Streptomyces sp. NPDC060031]|uniref:class I SAM-dependent methyltransferase n=1 Tax=Streptomyces sp. NPDC060031 TaxID=3347043 RepID=UPI0036C80CEF